MSFLYPKQSTFFDNLSDINTHTQALLGMLVDCLRANKIERIEFEQIHAQYHIVSEQYQDTVKKLNIEFLTPFDREDILALSAAYEHLGRDIFVVISEYSSLRGAEDIKLIDNCEQHISNIREHITGIITQLIKEDSQTTILFSHIETIKKVIHDSLYDIEMHNFTYMRDVASWKDGLFLLSFSRNIRMVLNRIIQLTQAYEQIIIKGF